MRPSAVSSAAACALEGGRSSLSGRLAQPASAMTRPAQAARRQAAAQAECSASEQVAMKRVGRMDTGRETAADNANVDPPSTPLTRGRG